MRFCPKLDVLLLVATTALARIAFRSHYLYDIDSVNYALALKRFDPSVHQPHPPGYFLYVYLGRLTDLLFGDANTAFVALSIVFSCGAVAIIYAAASDWFGRRAALLSGAVFVFSPLVWFHGTVALTYVVEAFFSALVGYFCWRISSGQQRYIFLAAVALGVGAGFRQSTLLLLAPLFLYSLRNTPGRQIASAIGGLVLTLLVWFVPMIRVSGGGLYVSSLLSLWRAVPGKRMVFNSSLINSFARAATIGGIYFLCFGSAALLPVTTIRARSPGDRDKAVFTAVWIVPGLLFFTFIYFRFVNSGYLLLLVPPVCLWMGKWASGWYQGLRLSPRSRLSLLAACAGINTAVFLYAPVYSSYNQTRHFEAELKSITSALPKIASPANSIIVGFDSHFLGYRHAGFYLPNYTTIQFPKVQLATGPRIFTMRDRDTRLETKVTAPPSIRSFVLFPLPSGDREYSDYMSFVRSRFPAGNLQTLVRDGHEFIVGDIADLHFLFGDPAPANAAMVINIEPAGLKEVKRQ